ncbi:MAG: AAA family ATPase [Candidatus Obscuribacterales bacterium]|nr:AAA family ATPase [Candidatus Obscuribacterales bacterium]
MAIIGFVNQKGGVGKSTTCYHLAYWLHKRGYKVLLVDADAQTTSHTWVQQSETGIESKVIQVGDELMEQLGGLSKEYDYVLVDGPGGHSEATKAILLCAHLAVVPCTTGLADIVSAAQTIKVIKVAQKYREGAPEAVMFLSRGFKGTRITREARRLLEDYEEVTVLKNMVFNRQLILDTWGQGATVWNLEGSGQQEAIKEYENLFTEIMGILGHDKQTTKATNRPSNRKHISEAVRR